MRCVTINRKGNNVYIKKKQIKNDSLCIARMYTLKKKQIKKMIVSTLKENEGNIY